MHYFIKLTAVIAVALVALFVLAIVLKIVVVAAIIAAVVVGCLFLYNLFRRKIAAPVTRYPSRW